MGSLGSFWPYQVRVRAMSYPVFRQNDSYGQSYSTALTALVTHGKICALIFFVAASDGFPSAPNISPDASPRSSAVKAVASKPPTSSSNLNCVDVSVPAATCSTRLLSAVYRIFSLLSGSKLSPPAVPRALGRSSAGVVGSPNSPFRYCLPASFGSTRNWKENASSTVSVSAVCSAAAPPKALTARHSASHRAILMTRFRILILRHVIPFLLYGCSTVYRFPAQVSAGLPAGVTIIVPAGIAFSPISVTVAGI